MFINKSFYGTSPIILLTQVININKYTPYILLESCLILISTQYLAIAFNIHPSYILTLSFFLVCASFGSAWHVVVPGTYKINWV